MSYKQFEVFLKLLERIADALEEISADIYGLRQDETVRSHYE